MADSLKAHNIPPFPIIPTQAVSGNVTSLVIDVFRTDNINVEFVWDGTLTGTFTAESSDDFLPPKAPGNAPVNPGNWTSLGLSGPAAGGPDSGVFDINQLSARYLRVKFTYTSGAGNLTATIVSKAV